MRPQAAPLVSETCVTSLAAGLLGARKYWHLHPELAGGRDISNLPFVRE